MKNKKTLKKISRFKNRSRPDIPGKKPKKTPAGQKTFPVVGIGASAGGLEAIISLLKSLPADTGMAVVFIQHLAP
ncbi:MAG: chemotaxis protein CheB, partial [Candidatus Omnitrophota bacterium]